MKEKIKKILKWAFLVAVVVLLFYFLFPKYDFIISEHIFLRCNRITGSCERLKATGENRYWESFIK